MVAVETGSAVKPSSRRTQMSWFTRTGQGRDPR